jgi:membrane-bound metal-dependent hydrolase YbcI (DUF457 family)
MCMGRTHAISGLVTGTTAGLYVLHLPLTGTVALAGLTAGAAVLPDLDHPKATLARSFGFLTAAFAWLVGKISGGHRWGTHSIIGVGIFTGLAVAAVHWRADMAGRIGLAVLLSLIIAGALYALRIGGHLADAIALIAAAVMTATGAGLSLVAVATGLGCATHVFADGLTDEGVPLAYPFSRYRVKLLPEPLAFTTDTKPETAFALVLCAALGALAYLAAMTPGYLA